MEQLPPPKSENAKALVVEGGGMKGAFSGGALACMCKLFPAMNYDLVVGVSAGSCVSAYYVTDTNGEEAQKILDIWKHELYGRKFISFLNPILKAKALLDQGYLIDHLFKSKYPLLTERLNGEGVPPFYVVVSDIRRKLPKYVKATSTNMFSLLKAATALPIATRGKRWFEGMLFGDGGSLDPIPVEEVIRAGYKDITVVLNQPQENLSPPIGGLLSRIAFPFEIEFARKIEYYHHLMYNKAKSILKNPPKGVKIQVIAPEERLPVKTTTTNMEKLQYTVHKGWQTAYRVFSRL